MTFLPVVLIAHAANIQCECCLLTLPRCLKTYWVLPARRERFHNWDHRAVLGPAGPGTGPSGRPNFHDVQIMLDQLASMKSSCRLKVSGIVEPRVINAYAFIRMGVSLLGTRSAVEIIEALPDVQKLLYPNS